MKLSRNAKNAFLLGGLCAIAYLAVYFARNVLSAVSQQMIDGGRFDEAYIGALSSTFFVFYAVGQLINGAIGDKINARYMISTGLLLAAALNAVFPLIATNSFLSKLSYGLVGFCLSFIYGPMTKVVSENVEPIHATRCGIAYTFSSYFGSPLAGVVAMIASWQWAFGISSVFLAFMATTCFLSFLALEKRGIVKYDKFSSKRKESRTSVKSLVKDYHVIKFSIISMVTGIIRTALLSWFVIYFAQHLKYSTTEAEGIFSITTIIISGAAFFSIFIYERLNRNMDLTIILAFLFASIGFGVLFFVKLRLLNIIILVISVFASNCAATMLWSRYCPSLYETGMVSTVTGFLDFLSYMAAALANVIFPLLVKDKDWSYVILVCFVLMLVGFVISLPIDKLKKKKAA